MMISKPLFSLSHYHIITSSQFLITSISFLSIFLFSSCKPKLDIPVPSAGAADFSKFIVVGGNYMAGCQDGALWKKGQEYSVGALLNEQFQLVGAGDFNQPLMPDDMGLGLNAKPWEGVFVHASRLGYKIDCEGVSALKPLKDTFGLVNAGIYLTGISGNSFQNLSVPHGRIQDFYNTGFSNSYQQGNANPFYHRFASNAGSSKVYTDALAQNPSFFAAWFGMEDIYEHARTGATNYSIPDGSTFWFYLDVFLAGLTTNDAKGIIANIPSLDCLPFFTTIPWDGLELTQSKADSLNNLTGNIFNFVPGKNGFVIEDPVSPGNYRKMVYGEYILLTIPLDSVKCNFMGVFTPIPDKYVLDVTEVYEIQTKINVYNSVIGERAMAYDIATVDMNSFFRTVRSGIKWDGVDVDMEFVSGGFFSLDGYHPHQKGYALIANEFLKAINSKYGATLPTINCFDCDGVIFP